MAENIEFVRNYSDLSTDRGFQFEFHCDRCASGFRTPFHPAASATITEVLDTAGSLLGGIFGRVADVGERVKSAGWQQARDKAFADALEELKPQFAQCPHCAGWVCRQSCWNEKRGLCKECAPDMGVEMSAAQAARSREEVWAHAKMSAEDKKLSESNWRETIVASCPKCQAPLATNAKFCPECGADLKAAGTCAGCGAQLQPGAKFCAECGAKTAPG